MRTLLLLALFAIHVTSFTLDNQQNNVLLFPKAQNKLAPFTINLSAGEDASQILSLTASCPPEVASALKFGSGNALCSSAGIQGTASSLNELLSGIMWDTSAVAATNATVSYSVSPVNTSNATTFAQSLALATSVPVTVLNDSIALSGTTSDASQVPSKTLLAQIAPYYLANAASSNLSVFYDEKPDWMDYYLDNGKIYLVATPPSNLASNFTMNYSINDSTRSLTSRLLAVRITQTTATGTTTHSKEQTQLYFLILLGIFTLIIALFVIVLYAVNKRAMAHDRLKESIGGQQNRAAADPHNMSYDGKASVLSDSILQWNKRLVEMHRHKGEQILNTSATRELEHESLNHSRANNYQRFDDSEHNEELSPVQGQATFEDISEIHQDGDLEPEIEQHDLVIRTDDKEIKRSSFIDEFKL